MEFDFNPIYLGLTIIAAGIISLWHSKVLRKRERSSLSWPSVIGQIIWVQWKFEGEGSGTHFEVRYRYFIDGKRMYGDNIAIAGGPGDVGRKAWDEWEELFSMGKQINVYYNPEAPSESVLIPGPVHYSPYELQALAITAVGLFVFLLFLGHQILALVLIMVCGVAGMIIRPYPYVSDDQKRPCKRYRSYVTPNP